jgi:hypothetical protein
MTRPFCLHSKDCARFRLEVKALRLLKSNKHIEAVNLMCAHPDNMTVPLTSLDRCGSPLQ